jgi:hypothetical protein
VTARLLWAYRTAFQRKPIPIGLPPGLLDAASLVAVGARVVAVPLLEGDQ